METTETLDQLLKSIIKDAQKSLTYLSNSNKHLDSMQSVIQEMRDALSKIQTDGGHSDTSRAGKEAVQLQEPAGKVVAAAERTKGS